jgi:hypothetical protein
MKSTGGSRWQHTMAAMVESTALFISSETDELEEAKQGEGPIFTSTSIIAGQCLCSCCS